MRRAALVRAGRRHLDERLPRQGLELGVGLGRLPPARQDVAHQRDQVLRGPVVGAVGLDLDVGEVPPGLLGGLAPLAEELEEEAVEVDEARDALGAALRLVEDEDRRPDHGVPHQGVRVPMLAHADVHLDALVGAPALERPGHADDPGPVLPVDLLDLALDDDVRLLHDLLEGVYALDQSRDRRPGEEAGEGDGPHREDDPQKAHLRPPLACLRACLRLARGRQACDSTHRQAGASTGTAWLSDASARD
jgi:hypothetical protein